MMSLFGAVLRQVEINQNGMQTLDWAIVIGMIVVLTGILLYCNKYMRSAADFLAANRCAGRYVMSISEGIAGFGLISAVATWEAFMKSGFASTWWGFINAPFSLILALVAWVTYRMRETRCFTLAQFYEMRYSRRFRIAAGMITFLSGVVNYGIFPMVSVKFLMTFCKIPDKVMWLGVNWDIYGILLAFCIGMGVFFAAFGGQIAIMVTDFLQGVICNVAFVIFIFFIFKLGDWDVSGGFVGWDQIADALCKEPGKSHINPFDCGKISDFNIWYYLIGFVALFYSRGGWQGSAGYAAAAKNPHERKMAGVMGTWRGLAQTLILMLFPLAVIAIMSPNLPEFAELRNLIEQNLAHVTNATQKGQDIVPMALSLIMPTGLLGLFVAVMFAAMLSTDDTYMHSWGSVLVQDIIMPFKKKAFSPKQHIWALRLAITAVGIFGWVFSYFWEQETPVLLFFSLTGAIVSGAGPAIIGGLYWKRGGTIAAWVSYFWGASTAVLGIVLQQTWPKGLAKWLLENTGWQWVANNMDSFPVNGQYISFINMVTCTALYIIISLIEHKMGNPDFNLDKMLHRGKYDTSNEHIEQGKVNKIEKVFGITPEFTIGDKLIYAASILWTIAWCVVFIVYTSLYFSDKLTNDDWLTLWHVKIYITLILGVGCTVWFLVGGIVDVYGLFKALSNVKRDDSDDGSVKRDSDDTIKENAENA